jgi:MoxR-like ATPase
MRRVAVFGNAGGGKSTLARRLAELTRLPLHSVDMMQFRTGGDVVPDEEYLKAHAQLLGQDWGCAVERCASAVRSRAVRVGTLAVSEPASTVAVAVPMTSQPG